MKSWDMTLFNALNFFILHFWTYESGGLFGVHKMRLLTALKTLKEMGVSVVGTRDVAYKFGVDAMHASQILRRLAEEKQIVHLSRGLWAIDPQVNPLSLISDLVAPFPCYVSLQTALYHHGMIDQIPRIITVVSLARTRRIDTPLATFSIHHIAPEFFCGYEVDTKTQVKMAIPEKALLDILYLKPAKSHWFKTLPEVEIPPSFSAKKAFTLIKQIPSQSRRTLVAHALSSLLFPSD